MLTNLVMSIWFPLIPIGIYPGRMAECCGTTCDIRQSGMYYEAMLSDLPDQRPVEAAPRRSR